MINIYRGPDGVIRWGPNPEGSKLVASVPYWEAARSAVRLLSMNEEFDGRFNKNGKLVSLDEKGNNYAPAVD